MSINRIRDLSPGDLDASQALLQLARPPATPSRDPLVAPMPTDGFPFDRRTDPCPTDPRSSASAAPSSSRTPRLERGRWRLRGSGRGWPLASEWREIALDHRTQEGSYDDTFDFSMTRWGPGYTAGMHKLRTRFSITI